MDIHEDRKESSYDHTRLMRKRKRNETKMANVLTKLDEEGPILYSYVKYICCYHCFFVNFMKVFFFKYTLTL